MSEQPVLTPPEQPEDRWENTVRETARHFPYPPTPDLTPALRQRVRTRRVSPMIWRIAAIILLALLAVVVAVPEVRAAVLNFIRIGVVQIFPLEPTATVLPGTATPRPPWYNPGQPTPLASVLDMPGETTLEEARAALPFSFGLPTYPVDIGEPDHVYLVDHIDKLLTLVWMQPDDPTHVRLILEVLNPRLLVSKFAVTEDSQYVRVKGRSDAIWLPAPHLVVYFFERDRFTLQRVVNASVLIWPEGALTYRMETDLPMGEAIRIAESVK